MVISMQLTDVELFDLLVALQCRMGCLDEYIENQEIRIKNGEALCGSDLINSWKEENQRLYALSSRISCEGGFYGSGVNS